MTTLNHFGQPIGDALPDWQPRERPAHLQLDGLWCHLEPLTCERHSKDLFNAWHSIDDNRDWTYLASTALQLSQIAICLFPSRKKVKTRCFSQWWITKHSAPWAAFL